MVTAVSYPSSGRSKAATAATTIFNEVGRNSVRPIRGPPSFSGGRVGLPFRPELTNGDSLDLRGASAHHPNELDFDLFSRTSENI